MRKPSESELEFAKQRVRASQGLALALSTTAGILHEGMQHTETLLESYDADLAYRRDLLDEVEMRLFRLDDLSDRELKATIKSEIRELRGWLLAHWTKGTQVASKVER